MRTFHIGGAATKVSEENRIYLKYPVLVTDVVGTFVKMPEGRSLFTRKGALHACKIFTNIEIGKGDKILVQDGQRILKGDTIVQRADKSVAKATDISYAKVIPDSKTGAGRSSSSRRTRRSTCATAPRSS